jgi:alpha-galactosidase
MGFYRLAKMLTEKHPEILFEGCASGGNRFDLGMLCYFPQIWASDNTDALSRIDIQTGYSYGYPQMVYTCHISSVPNHQTLREVSLETRAHVAFFGNLGVECNLLDMPKDEYESLKELITIYKKYRGVFQKGVFHRGIFGDITEWTVVSLDQVIGIGLVAQKIIKPSDPHLTYFAKGLNPDYKYHFYNIPKEISVKEFGGLLNMVSPVHVKQDSKLHNMIDRFYHLEGDFEDSYKYGDALMSAGARLTQNYIGTGVNNNVRVFKGGDSRLYFMEALGVEGKKDQSHIQDY